MPKKTKHPKTISDKMINTSQIEIEAKIFALNNKINSMNSEMNSRFQVLRVDPTFMDVKSIELKLGELSVMVHRLGAEVSRVSQILENHFQNLKWGEPTPLRILKIFNDSKNPEPQDK